MNDVLGGATPAAEGRIDLNADMGEERGDDVALLEVVTSANVATGAHAGGGAVLTEVTRAAVARGVAIGAHPSYRDRDGFGRSSLLTSLRDSGVARAAFITDLSVQILDVAAEAEAAGGRLDHVKAHGSLYNEAVADRLAAEVVLDAVAAAQDRYGRALAVVTQPGGQLASSASRAGFAVILEGFVDRAYDSTGQLVPRTLHGAVHRDLDVMVRQALDLARGRIRSADGTVLTMPVASLCVHGDTPGAVAAARAVRGALEDHGWLISAARAGQPAADARLRAPGDWGHHSLGGPA